MDSLEHKKTALLRILQILQRYSDENHPLKQEDMIKILNVEYGIPLERKAIGRKPENPRLCEGDAKAGMPQSLRST